MEKRKKRAKRVVKAAVVEAPQETPLVEVVAPVVVEQIPAAVIPLKTAPEIVKKTPRNWFKILPAAAMVIAGLIIAFIGNAAVSAPIIVLGAAIMAGGVMLFMSGWKTGGVRIITADEIGDTTAPTVKVGGIPNSLNLYKNKIAFECVENPIGQQQKCYNDTKWYFVHKFNYATSRLEEFSLPDDEDSQRYYHPREFANVVTMPANKKLFEPIPSLFQKIAIGIMAVVIGAEIIGLIALSGS